MIRNSSGSHRSGDDQKRFKFCRFHLKLKKKKFIHLQQLQMSIIKKKHDFWRNHFVIKHVQTELCLFVLEFILASQFKLEGINVSLV